MLNLPKSTEVGKFLPKEKLIDKLNLTPALKESLKDDVRRFTITHELSEKSLNIPKGDRVSAVFIIEVALKQKNIDYKLIEAVARQNAHKILFVLRHEDEAQIAVFYGKLYKNDWTGTRDLNVDISGFSFDEVWDSLVAQVALTVPVRVNIPALPVADMLARQEEIAKLKREIERLENKARKERQPKRKFEIVGKIHEMKRTLEGYRNG